MDYPLALRVLDLYYLKEGCQKFDLQARPGPWVATNQPTNWLDPASSSKAAVAALQP